MKCVGSFSTGLLLLAACYVANGAQYHEVQPLARRDAESGHDTHAVVHDASGEYALRFKKTQSCENSLQYSGYLDNLKTDDHLFFWFVESRSSPQTDPMLLWLNGGPGCSSVTGAWMEIGPCLVTEAGNDTMLNPYSWNTMSNVLFLDQPVNTGYSYGSSNVSSSVDAARYSYAFLQLFFQTFKKYAHSELYIAGESFGGHFVPPLTMNILEGNKVLQKDQVRINLVSILIGNGWTNPRTQFQAYHTFACTNDGPLKPLFDQKTCDKMKKEADRCKTLMDACYRTNSLLACLPAGLYCQTTQTNMIAKAGVNMNPYDIRKKCEGDPSMCYRIYTAIDYWANRKDVRQGLGVDTQIQNFTSCNAKMPDEFAMHGDSTRDYSPFVAKALTEGVRVLLYSGDVDWTCNWYGTKAWALELEWPGKQDFNQAQDEQWFSWTSGEIAGEVRSHGNLTFLRVYDAGHMVPMDQPANSLDFFNRWINQMPLTK
ncbi:Alpha/Beta hydrolase protein [Radiomyces spectabilis]|uniref:Alpha/Beta hydrolase protein n=1 Tax=Radiomyces spectabilis TaxID=64574 RepID=UPI00221EFA6C|nr:Alpha/Beta hydrolase protein [Radiomyces spectabilis]KAI8371622.1 Alpha/Beta hydrolase protein [Radiomyces spectabilis]